MDKEEYRIALAKLGWTQREAAQKLGFHERTSRKYALGESPIPETVAILLRIRLVERKLGKLALHEPPYTEEEEAMLYKRMSKVVSIARSGSEAQREQRLQRRAKRRRP